MVPVKITTALPTGSQQRPAQVQNPPNMVSSGLNNVRFVPNQPIYIYPNMTSSVPMRLPASNGTIRMVQVPHQVMQRPHVITGVPLTSPAQHIQQQPIQPPQQPPKPPSKLEDNNRPSTNVQKCKNFFECLKKLSSTRSKDTVDVMSLIQQLINADITVNDFCEQLSSKLQGGSQNHDGLRNFLENVLPQLRTEMYHKRITIDGLQAPPMEALNNSVISISNQMQPVQTQRIIRPAPQPNSQIRPQTPNHSNISFVNRSTPTIRPSLRPAVSNSLSSVQRMSNNASASVNSVYQKQTSTPRKTTLTDDDDLNDVAAMGGVNLSEETKNIIGDKPLTFRSCRDQTFLSSNLLKSRLSSIVNTRNLPDVSDDAVILVAHAVQMHLKSVIERLSVSAIHRTTPVDVESSQYNCVDNVKGQLKFLESMDKEEKERHELQEKELLFKAAKSRARIEDPEQIKLKERARLLQLEESERLKQRDANITALNAIGIRKKRILDLDFTELSNSQGTADSFLAKKSRTGATVTMNRNRRAVMKDLQFVLSNDKRLKRSKVYHKTFMK